MKLNHFICPNCGHDFYSDCAYATCDACQLFFYASESETSIGSRNTTLCNCYYHKSGETTGGWYCPVHGQQF